eukprot:m.33770 g.33770  ORF g.33770 m.33770 type:complete len:229 (+) comp31882_c0_seq4:3138-3824(+)
MSTIPAATKISSRKRTHTAATDPLPADRAFLESFHQEYLARKQQRRVMQRKAANGRERKRVRRINTAFNELEAKLQESNVTPPNDQCLSKIKTLRSAIDYIEALSQLLQGDESSSGSSTAPSSPMAASENSHCMYSSSDVATPCLRQPPPLPPAYASFPFQQSLSDLMAPSLHQIWPECVGTFASQGDVTSHLMQGQQLAGPRDFYEKSDSICTPMPVFSGFNFFVDY